MRLDARFTSLAELITEFRFHNCPLANTPDLDQRIRVLFGKFAYLILEYSQSKNSFDRKCPPISPTESRIFANNQERLVDKIGKVITFSEFDSAQLEELFSQVATILTGVNDLSNPQASPSSRRILSAMTILEKEKCLFLAAHYGNQPIANLLIDDGTNVNIHDPDQAHDTPLILAVRKGNLELVNRLIQAMARVNLANQSGLTPLHAAALCEEPSAEKIIQALTRAGATGNSQDRFGHTPTYYAKERLQILLDAKNRR